MSKSIVILQPQYIPWIGVFEQIRLADIYVHYDDVQYPQGRSFTNRVQIKTSNGPKWLTVPVKKGAGKTLINEICIDNKVNWRRKHKETVRHAYSNAPYLSDVMDLVENITSQPFENLSDLNCYALELIADYFEFDTVFEKSSALGIAGKSTQRLVDICSYFDADRYITGLGARNYVDYSEFENHNIKLHYMRYEKVSYPQLHGEFTPFVTVLDLIANCGKKGSEVICSNAKYWQDIVNIDSL